MSQRSGAGRARRFQSSERGRCARATFVWLLLASASICGAQDLRLQPADDGDQTTPAEQLATEEIPDPGAALETPLEPPPQASVAETTSAPTASTNVTEVAPEPNLADADGALQLALQRTGSLNLHDVELRAALFMISEQWGINIVCGKVEGTVNGVFRNAPLREILDSILLSNGYNYRAVGESLVVSSVEDLGQINPFFQSATIPVRSADIDEVVQGARLLTTPKGQIQPLKSARSIVVLDFPDRVKMIRDFVSSIDRATNGGIRAGEPLEVGYFRTQHISAKVAEEALQAVLSKEGRVGVMEKDDRLVISDHADNLAMVQTVLERIDRPRPQVRITALIYDISLQDIEELGINWDQVGLVRNGETSLGIDSVMKVPFEAGTTGSALTFMNLSEHLDMTAVVLALSNANDARLLANPSVAVLENEEAIFQSVSEIPYQQLTETSAGGQIGTTAFKEAGITLRVLPKIASDGTIRMTVSPEFSRLTGFTPGDNQPIIDKRVATTTLGVANRQTIVIGGLRERRDIGDFKGVPYLMDMKVIGKLFRSRETNVRESELVVFISPEIISTSDPVSHRERMIIDTMGCRLNQIPEAEGCPPPCDCPSEYAYRPTAGPVRLPPAYEIVAAPGRPGAPSSGVDAQPRRLPAVGEALTFPNTAQAYNLFDAPPVPGVELARPQERQNRTGGWIQVGSGPVPVTR